MRRRQFITLLGGAAATWPLAARAQQPSMPIVGFVSTRSAEDAVRQGGLFRKGLNETGYVEGQNVMVEYHWLEGQYNRVTSLVADLVRRRVAVIATPGSVPTLAAKAATAAIPIVFGIAEDPVKRGLVTSLARPGGNAGFRVVECLCLFQAVPHVDTNALRGPRGRQSLPPPRPVREDR
jgi:putative ABC transport system substrate-binding protein